MYTYFAIFNFSVTVKSSNHLMHFSSDKQTEIQNQLLNLTSHMRAWGTILNSELKLQTFNAIDYIPHSRIGGEPE